MFSADQVYSNLTCPSLVSQTSFGHISMNTCMIPMVLDASEIP